MIMRDGRGEKQNFASTWSCLDNLGPETGTFCSSKCLVTEWIETMSNIADRAGIELRSLCEQPSFRLCPSVP